MVNGARHWRGGGLFLLGWAESITVGNANGSGQHPRSYRSQWRQTSTWPILLNWLSQAQLSCHSQRYHHHQWFLGRTLKVVQYGTAAPSVAKRLWVRKEDTDSALCLFSFYFGFTMYSGAEVLNVRDFLRQIWTLLFLSFLLLSSLFCLHVLNY